MRVSNGKLSLKVYTKSCFLLFIWRIIFEIKVNASESVKKNICGAVSTCNEKKVSLLQR